MKYMRFNRLAISTVLSALVFALTACEFIKEKEETKYWPTYVNTLIGTDWVGNTFPGASMPFGLVQLSPDNGRGGWNYIAGYYYPDSMIVGFSHTHLSGTGAGDLYDISYMPYPASSEKTDWGKRIRFDHKSEIAEAGYYALELENGIKVELTASEHCGIQRYTSKHKEIELQLDLARAINWDRTVGSNVKLINDTCIEGYRYSEGWAKGQKVFFRTSFSHTIKAMEIDTVQISQSDNQSAHRVRLLFALDNESLEQSVASETKHYQLTLATALSATDLEGAKYNLQAECDGLDFDRQKEQAQDVWQRELTQIETKEAIASSIDTIFRTALYHCLLCPNLISDVDGRYRKPDEAVSTASKAHYSCFSLWDTYRALHPLLQLIDPNRSKEMASSLLRFAQDNEDMLPVWSLWGKETNMMIGQHAIPVLVDSYLKGNFPEEQIEYTSDCFFTNHRSRNTTNNQEIKRHSFLSVDDEDESVSKTLEYAYDDYAIHRWHEAITNKSKAETDHNYWQRAAWAYRELYDPTTGFFRPKQSNGEWLPNFDPFEYSKHYTESNAWQYLFAAQHDIEWLLNQMGGTDAFADRLDQFFTLETPHHIELPIFSTGMIGQYAHGNEPSHHVIYLYNQARKPWKVAELLRKVMLDYYKNSPDGLCGNEDCGQLSAWYLFSSMGFYPVDPLSNRYELGSPLFEETRLPIGNNKYFSIRAVGLSKDKMYIESVKVNGKPYTKSYITLDMIRSGAKVELKMSDRAGHIWY